MDDSRMGNSGLKLRIRTKLVLLTALVMLLAVFISDAIIYTRGRSIFQQRILSDLNAIAKSRADQVLSLIEQDFERTALVASRTKLRECLASLESGSPEPSQLRERMVKILNDAKRPVPTIRTIDVCGRNGNLAASTNSEHIGREVSGREWFVRGKRGRYLGQFRQEEGISTVNFALPLVDPTPERERVIGVVRTQMSLERLMTVLTDRTGLGDSGEAILVFEKEGVVTVLNPLWYRPGAALTPLRELGEGAVDEARMALREETGVTRAKDYRGVETLIAYRHVPVQKGFGLVVKIDVDDAFAPVKNLQTLSILVGAGLLIAGICAVMAIAVYIMRPIKRLRAGAERLGKGELDYRVEVKRQDEMGDLAKTFNSMAGNLQQITASHEELDREVRQRKEAEDELQETVDELKRSNEELEQFAYVVSHDLQEPLRMVASYVQLLKKRYGGELDSDADEFIEYAVDGAMRMKQMINDLLEYSRVGTRGEEFTPTDCNEVLDEARQNLQLSVKESDAEIESSELPTVQADESQMRQLFQNLLGNAIKFRSDEPPRIEVDADSQDGKWVFSVSDNGIGMEAEQAERIFRIFQRLHARDDYEGTGIGLAVCRRIVERHGGEIWVESEPGEGSTFYFTIRERDEHDSGRTDRNTAGGRRPR